jgi:isochorismate synthase
MKLKENTAIIYVGGGITASSNPESEWEETVSKSLIIKNIL